MVGLAVSTAVSPAALNTGAVTAAMPGIGLQRVVDAVDGRLVGRRRELDDDLDRAVEAGAEAVGQLVVGDALRSCRSAALPSSGTPIRMLSAGTAMAHRATRLTRA